MQRQVKHVRELGQCSITYFLVRPPCKVETKVPIAASSVSDSLGCSIVKRFWAQDLEQSIGKPHWLHLIAESTWQTWQSELGCWSRAPGSGPQNEQAIAATDSHSLFWQWVRASLKTCLCWSQHLHRTLSRKLPVARAALASRIFWAQVWTHFPSPTPSQAFAQSRNQSFQIRRSTYLGSSML